MIPSSGNKQNSSELAGKHQTPMKHGSSIPEQISPKFSGDFHPFPAFSCWNQFLSFHKSLKIAN